MKYAYVHDRIFFPGGGQQVFEDLIQKYEAQEWAIFTLFSDKRELHIGGRAYAIHTSLPERINKIFVFFSLHKVVFLSWLFDYRNLFVFYPFLCRFLSRKINAYTPDLVVVSSFAAVKNVVTDAAQILYLHSPNQYIRENYDEYIAKFRFPTKQIFQFATSYIRRRDKKWTTSTYQKIYANSAYTAACAQKYYLFSAEILYPKIPEQFFTTACTTTPYSYYVYVWRLVRFIRETDRVIMLANELQIPLLVLGSGPDEEYLKSIAWPTITFLGHIADLWQKIEILRNARGLINLTKESFWIATIEALCLWVPVFGFEQWGTKELVDSRSWLLVASKDMDTLTAGFQRFAAIEFDRKWIQQRCYTLYTSYADAWASKGDTGLPIVGSIK